MKEERYIEVKCVLVVVSHQGLQQVDLVGVVVVTLG